MTNKKTKNVSIFTPEDPEEAKEREIVAQYINLEIVPGKTHVRTILAALVKKMLIMEEEIRKLKKV